MKRAQNCFITWICKAQAPPKRTRSARMSLSWGLKLRSVIVRISIRATPFSSGSNRSWLLKSKSTDVLSRRVKQYSMPVAVSWRILGIGMNYFTDLIRHLIYVILLILPLAYHRAWMYIPFTAMTNFFRTFLFVRLCDNPALLVVWKVAKIWTQGTQHVSVVESAPPASLVNEPYFAVDVTCRLVIRGYILRAQRAIAIRSPYVALWSFRRHFCAYGSRCTLKGFKEI